jgi:DNA-directed RNA polymerase subunit D
MEIQQLKKSENKLIFLIKGINAALANTLRRFMTSEVSILAIDEVNIIKNSSAMFDEVLAHRLGLIPLKTDLKSYNLKEECSCKNKGCPKCQLSLILNIKGPCTVYSSNLKSQDPKIQPVYPKMLIVKLQKDQEIELEAIARLGKGKKHNKFSPGLIFYRNYPVIKIGSNCNICKKCVSVCPKKILEIKNKKLTIKNLIECDLCLACVNICPKKEIKVTENPKEFIFTIESWGQLTPKEIYEEALNKFDKKLDELAKKIKKI